MSGAASFGLIPAYHGQPMVDARSLVASLAGDRPCREVDDDILDFGPTAAAHYDAMGWLYDAVCGTAVYNRVVWGTNPAHSRDFASRIFDSRSVGPHVEVGCGALLFTSHLYVRDRGRPCILIDPSIEMLRMARSRLRRRIGCVPSYVALVRADGRDLPLMREFASTVLSMHVLHVIEARELFLRSLVSLASPGASTVGFTSLVKTGAHRDAFLALLHATGELSTPLSVELLTALARASLPVPPTIEVVGNMAFVSGSSAP